MVFRRPDLSHGGLELERLKDHAGSLDTPGGIKAALAMIVEFAVVENILGGDGDTGRAYLISMLAGWLDRDVFNAPPELKRLRFIRSVLQMNDSHFLVDSRSRIMAKVGTYH